jgi:hypothetical protein
MPMLVGLASQQAQPGQASKQSQSPAGSNERQETADRHRGLTFPTRNRPRVNFVRRSCIADCTVAMCTPLRQSAHRPAAQPYISASYLCMQTHHKQGLTVQLVHNCTTWSSQVSNSLEAQPPGAPTVHPACMHQTPEWPCQYVQRRPLCVLGQDRHEPTLLQPPLQGSITCPQHSRGQAPLQPPLKAS